MPYLFRTMLSNIRSGSPFFWRGAHSADGYGAVEDKGIFVLNNAINWRLFFGAVAEMIVLHGF